MRSARWAVALVSLLALLLAACSKPEAPATTAAPPAAPAKPAPAPAAPAKPAPAPAAPAAQAPAKAAAPAAAERRIACTPECEKLVGPVVAPKDKLAATTVDTTKFKKNPPYRIGVSAGYMVNSWQNFHAAYIRWAVDTYKDKIREMVFTDANFKVDKQIADIESLLTKDIDILLYWPIDDKAIRPALKKAQDKGIPVISTGGGLNDFPELATAADVDNHRLGAAVALQLAKDMKGKGNIIAMVPVAGYLSTTEQLDGLKAILASYPDMKLLDVGYGDWQRQKAKSITENLIQKYPKIDGVFSPSGIMSTGMTEAFEEAGLADKVVFSPGDEYNGWLKWVRKTGKAGAVTYPPRMGYVAVEKALEVLAGRPVKKITPVPSEFFTADEVKAGKFVEPSKPDDYWASELPEAYKPK